jgi:hypothetical protein
MHLPHVTQPDRYRGLYVYDFGEWTAVGYTAEEIAMLLESQTYGTGHVYKIVRATPDGGMELRGIATQRFHVESGLFFYRRDRAAADLDFETLTRLAGERGAPCRAYAHLVDRGAGEESPRYVTALVYPAEYDDEWARWLLDVDYQGGDTVEGGPSHVSNHNAEAHRVLRRQQLWSQSNPSRSADEVFASIRRAVQR